MQLVCEFGVVITIPFAQCINFQIIPWICANSARQNMANFSGEFLIVEVSSTNIWWIRCTLQYEYISSQHNFWRNLVNCYEANRLGLQMRSGISAISFPKTGRRRYRSLWRQIAGHAMALLWKSHRIFWGSLTGEFSISFSIYPLVMTNMAMENHHF